MRISKRTIEFASKPRILASHCITGPMEGKGPLKDYFYDSLKDCKFGEKTFEKAERKMLFTAIKKCVESSNIDVEEIDWMFSGDLLNQIISSSYAARNFDFGFLGLYGACSTIAEGLILAAMSIDSKNCNKAVVAAGSHYATAERQYRFPLELGSQIQPYAQRTVTGTGAYIIGQGTGVSINRATIGRVVDYGIRDVANMGGAMAPAAMDTIKAHFEDTKTSPNDYDMIVTGDLGKLGSDIFRKLMKDEGYEMGQNYIDCGNMIFSVEQNVCQGGSGCGCGTVVLGCYLLDKLKKGEYKRVLFAATGALMSQVANQQGDTIPAVAHAVTLEA